MADEHAEIRAAINKRFAEIEEEAERLVRAQKALAGAPDLVGQLEKDWGGEPKPKDIKPGRRKRAKPGRRRKQLLKAIEDQPGITVAEAAKKFGVKPPNALYTLAKVLVVEGVVVKDGASYKIKTKSEPKNAAPKRKRKASKNATKKPRR